MSCIFNTLTHNTLFLSKKTVAITCSWVVALVIFWFSMACHPVQILEMLSLRIIIDMFTLHFIMYLSSLVLLSMF